MVDDPALKSGHALMTQSMLEQQKKGVIEADTEVFERLKREQPLGASVGGSQKSPIKSIQSGLPLSLYPVQTWYPAGIGVMPSGAMLHSHQGLLAAEAKKGIPRTAPLMLKKTAVTEQIFDKTMGQFHEHYGELDGWKDAVRLGISYALQDFVREVESFAGGLNNDEFAFNYSDWDKLKKGVGVQVTP